MSLIGQAAWDSGWRFFRMSPDGKILLMAKAYYDYQVQDAERGDHGFDIAGNFWFWSKEIDSQILNEITQKFFTDRPNMRRHYICDECHEKEKISNMHNSVDYSTPKIAYSKCRKCGTPLEIKVA